MAGVYGEFLGFFPELFEDFDVYQIKPLIGGGYEKEFSRRISGVVQTVDVALNSQSGYSRKVNSSGTESGIVSETKGIVLWTSIELELKEEVLMYEKQFYRPLGASIWSKEGGFYRTELRMVVGETGSTNTVNVIQGTF